MMPRFLGSSMLEIMGEWLNMAFYRLKGVKTHAIPPIANPLFAHVVLASPELPAPGVVEMCSLAFWDTIYNIFPFLDRDEVESMLVVEFSSSTSLRLVHDAPGHALAYLILAAGLLAVREMDETAILVSKYLSYCNALLGHVLATRSIQSVQTLLLFAIVLRSCDKVAWAWDVLTVCVSMAQSLGINQARYTSAEKPGGNYLTWLCLYVFEKILAFELSRPSAIWDRELSGTQVTLVKIDMNGPSDQKFWQASVSIANVLHAMQERSARSWRREEFLPQSVDEAIAEKIRAGGELIVLLQEWQQSLPAEFQYVLSLFFGTNWLTLSDRGLFQRPISTVNLIPHRQRSFHTTIISGNQISNIFFMNYDH